jgi:hypothetical protein
VRGAVDFDGNRNLHARSPPKPAVEGAVILRFGSWFQR